MNGSVVLNAYNDGIDIENVVLDHLDLMGGATVVVGFFAEDGGAVNINHMTAEIAGETASLGKQGVRMSMRISTTAFCGAREAELPHSSAAWVQVQRP